MSLTHIVLWNFKEEVKEEDKDTIITNMMNNLLSLKEVRKELIDIKFIPHPIKTSTCDFALYVVVKNEEDLKLYSESKEHVFVANAYIKPYATNRTCLDFIL